MKATAEALARRLNRRAVRLMRSAAPAWRAVIARSGAEKAAQRDLERDGAIAYLPLETRRMRIGGSRHAPVYEDRAVPAIAGLLFAYSVEPIELSIERWPSLHGQICIGAAPAELSSRALLLFIQHNRGRFTRRAVSAAEKPLWRPVVGQAVQIAAGPYAGQTTRVEALSGDAVWVVMQMLGGQRAVEIGVANLKTA